MDEKIISLIGIVVAILGIVSAYLVKSRPRHFKIVAALAIVFGFGLLLVYFSPRGTLLSTNSGGEDPVPGMVLSGANLRKVEWLGVNLASADLSKANLQEAILFKANLAAADLSNANLQHTDLSKTNLSNANLSFSILREANLRSAVLHGANLQGADLSGADLKGAVLRGANFEGAILSGADLSMTNGLTWDSLAGAHLSEETRLPKSLEKPPG
jgi:uncharacterized protein YjbI with pentapeptide repeats